MNEVNEMTDNEKKDMLIEFLTTLYRISAENNVNKALEYETKVIEKRLNVLGVINLEELKPTK